MRRYWLPILILTIVPQVHAVDSSEMPVTQTQWSSDSFAKVTRGTEEAKAKAFLNGLLPEEKKPAPAPKIEAKDN